MAEEARRWHLAPTADTQVMTGTAFAMMRTMAAYQRAATNAFRLACDADLTFNDIVILHVVAMHDRPKDAATIARLVNREDLPNVLYNLRKIVAAGLIEKSRGGSSTLFSITPEGREAAMRYAAIRKRVILDWFRRNPETVSMLPEVSFTMQHMTGVYDAQTRELASLDPARVLADLADAPVPAAGKPRPRRPAR